MPNEDEKEKHTVLNECFICKREVEGKPWISVDMGFIYHGCSYLCSKQLNDELGENYWDNVINKEDFDVPRPVCQITNISTRGDITTGFGLDEIRDEIEQENQRIEMLEYEYNVSSSDEDTFDEDNYY